jgi:Protein of unknown function (DUF1501)
MATCLGRHAEVTDGPVTPADLTATVFHLLGADPHAVVRDARGRPLALSEGRPVAALLGGQGIVSRSCTGG